MRIHVKSKCIKTLNQTCPLSKRPLYTRPKPPSPNRQSCLKFLVAAASSRKVNVCAAICWLFPSLGITVSFLESNKPCGFGLSKAKVHPELGVVWIEECNIGKVNYSQNTIIKMVKLAIDHVQLCHWFECLPLYPKAQLDSFQNFNTI